MRGTTFAPKKWAARLNISPSSFAQIRAFTETCTIKNKTRKIPLAAIVIFCPTEEVKACFHVIYKQD